MRILTAKEVTSVPEFKFYYGAANGQSRKALRKMEEPRVMINYATKNNQPWDAIEELFVDSGGYSFMLGKGEYQTPAADYLDYVEAHQPSLYVLRDYPCEQEVLDEHDRSVDDHQRMTVNAHRRCWDEADDRAIKGQRVSVLQGQTVDDYLRHADQLRDHGVLADYVGIGSVCGREDISDIRRIILTIATNVDADLHAFGVKRRSLLQFSDVVEALSSADSLAYDKRGQYAAFEDNRPHNWREDAYQYLRYKRRIAAIKADDPDPSWYRDDGQQSLTEATQ